MIPDMGDYAVYVWPAYGLAALVLVWSVGAALALRRRGQRMLRTARDRAGSGGL